MKQEKPPKPEKVVWEIISKADFIPSETDDLDLIPVGCWGYPSFFQMEHNLDGETSDVEP